MAFVFRGQRKTDLSKKNNQVGPGSYEMDVEKQGKMPKAYVPFGTMQPRSKEPQLKDYNAPGPGTYNIVDNQSGEKIVVSSETQDIKILEISRPNHVFKSGTERFKQTKEEDMTPGPGEYHANRHAISRPKILSTNTNTSTNQKPKIIEHLININKYQSIPSIPSIIHAYGYNENENNQLELNQPPVEVFKGQKDDKIGPGHYNIEKEKTKGTSLWSQAKEKRLEETKTNINIGPGSYEPKNVTSLYNYKPSVGFASKTLRSMDQRKGAIVNQQKRNEKIIEDQSSVASQLDSRVMSEKAPPSTKVDDDSDDQYEYIEQTTPGPGAYLEISQVKNFKTQRPTPGFGVSSKRFGGGSSNTNQQIGPGSYSTKGTFKKQKQKKLPVPKQIERFPELTNKKKVEQPGPGSYEPRNTMEDKLIYKIQRGYRGQFGSTETRSKDPEDDENPGPGQYDPHEVVDEKDALSVFKSKSKRKGISDGKGNAPGVGMYSITQNDIANRVIKQEEQDPDLIIRKPGFGVGEERFKAVVKKEDEFEDDDIIKQIQDKYREEKKRKMLKNSPAFRNNEPRLQPTKSDNPGPGAYYDGQQDHWNKRTYNILFADI